MVLKHDVACDLITWSLLLIEGPNGGLTGTVDDRWPSSWADWLSEPSLPPRPQGGMVHPLSAPAVCLLGAAQTTYAHFCSGFAFEIICLPISDIILSSHPFLYILILYSPPIWCPAILVNYQCNLLLSSKFLCWLELLNTVTNLIFVFIVHFPNEHTTNCN